MFLSRFPIGLVAMDRRHRVSNLFPRRVVSFFRSFSSLVTNLGFYCLPSDQLACVVALFSRRPRTGTRWPVAIPSVCWSGFFPRRFLSAVFWTVVGVFFVRRPLSAGSWTVIVVGDCAGRSRIWLSAGVVPTGRFHLFDPWPLNFPRVSPTEQDPRDGAPGLSRIVRP